MKYTEDQFTEWFDIEKQKPWAPGVYEVAIGMEDALGRFSYWNGKEFNWCTCQGVDKAFSMKYMLGAGAAVQFWRGLNFNPQTLKNPTKKKGNKRKTMWLIYERFNFSGSKTLCAIGSTRKEAVAIKKQRDSLRYAGYSFIIEPLRFRTPEA